MKKPIWLLVCMVVLVSSCSDETPLCPDAGGGPGQDTRPPSRVTDLEVAFTTDTTVGLQWTAPGDDFTEGRAGFYDVRYSSDRDALLAWADTCYRAVDLTPANSGETENITITNLDVSESNYFALKTADTDSNWSAISNIVFASTRCPLEISAPVSGAYFCEGDTVDISWLPLDCQSETVSVFLESSDHVCREIGRNIPNSGEYQWVAQRCLFDSGGYKITIETEGEDSVSASSGIFTITQGCAVEVNFPNGGEVLCRGTRLRVNWSRSSCCESPTLVELLHNDTVADTLGFAAASGLDWDVTSPLAAEAGYRIRVTNELTGAYDTSDYSFQISVPHAPEVQYPEGGEVLSELQAMEISWDPQECAGNDARIELQYLGETCLVIAEDTPNDGSYTWTPSSAGAGAFGYQVMVTDLETGYSGISRQEFTISRDCVLEYMTPVMYSSFCPQEPMLITWNSTTWCGELVSIEVLLGGQNYFLAESTENDGSFEAPAPPLLGETTPRLRITDLSNGMRILGPPITLFPACTPFLTFPIGGEVLAEGLPVSIAWSAGECCGPELDIHLLKDGELCSVIAEGLDISQGQYEWIVAGCDGQVEGYQIRIIENGYNQSFQSSPAFSIEEGCGLLVLGPLAGEVYNAGDGLPVSWSSNSSCDSDVDVELLDAEGGVLWGPVSVPNTGFAELFPSVGFGGETTCRLRVTDQGSSRSAASALFVFRSSPFTVRPDGTGDFPTLQQAVDAAGPGFEILLADGVYTGSRSQSLVWTGNGGFTIRSTSGNPEDCILDGESTIRLFYFRDADGPIHVSGITFRNGKAQLDNMYRGGAVSLRGSEAVFANCVFEENEARTGGGAAYVATSLVEFHDCVFRGNSMGNSAVFNGVAIDGYRSPGAVSAATLSMNGCTFVGNNNSGGSVIALQGDIECVVANTIIGFNSASAFYSDQDEPSLLFTCSDFFMNAQEGWPEELAEWLVGHENFSADPEFCDLETGDVNLRPTSPCVGTNSPCGETVGARGVGCR